MTLATHLRERRRELGLTQREVAAVAATSRATVSRLERGAGLPEVATLARIAGALDQRVMLCFQSRRAGVVDHEFCEVTGGRALSTPATE